MPNKLTCIVAGALFLLASAAQAEAVQPARSRGHVVLLSNLLGAPGTFGLYFMANSSRSVSAFRPTFGGGVLLVGRRRAAEGQGR